MGKDKSDYYGYSSDACRRYIHSLHCTELVTNLSKPYQSDEAKSFARVDENFTWLPIFSKQLFELILVYVIGQISNEKAASLGVGFLTRPPEQGKSCLEWFLKTKYWTI